MEAINRLDTDVNSIENARSDNATLKSFAAIGYNKGIGPGTHSKYRYTLYNMLTLTLK
jgi:5-methyltetrahydropteroyltriglutamate--homocysteine methyltransferase